MAYQLVVNSIIKTFKNKKILSDVCLNCESNEIVGIFGRNGVGKSTLLKIIFGTEESENKFIKIDNVVFNKAFEVKNQISYLPQNSFIPKHLSVNQSIKAFIGKGDLEYFYEDDLINLMKNKKTSALSGGELRYLEIKLILFSKTKFSLLDEPFLGLSPLLIEKVKELILLVSKNKGILITDHDYRNVLDIVTKLYLIKDCKTILLHNERELMDYGYLARH
jgi:lipopolysaccharide export system ATP-binding protein